MDLKNDIHLLKASVNIVFKVHKNSYIIKTRIDLNKTIIV
jgi:hypothetical protein